MRLLFIYPNEMMLNPPPISIGVLTAALKNEVELGLFDTTYYPTFSQSSDKAKEYNLQVRPFDFAERGISLKRTDVHADLKRKVETFDPDLIAISILEPTFLQAMSLLEVIEGYGIPVIAGGVFTTFAPEQTLGLPGVKMVCVGEGEEALLEVCRKMNSGKSLDGTQNLFLKEECGIMRNGIRPVIDINKTPVPDYDLFDAERFFRPMAGRVYRTVPVETNRGCPYGCAYCNSPAQSRLYREIGAGTFFRKKTLKRIGDELNQLVTRYNPEYVYFTSDTFLVMTNNEFDEFVEIYSNYKLPFWIQTRPETVTPYRVKKLKMIGCHRMSIGVEHGNYEFRRNILKKDVSNEAIIRACDMIAEGGIPLTINNIIGFPGETRELIFDTIRLNRELKFDTTNAYAFAPFHGTPLHERCVREKLILDTASIRNLTIDAGLDMPQLRRKEIEGLRKTFALYARLPEYYWPRIEVAEGEGDEARKAFEELRNIYIMEFFKREQ